MMTKQYNFALEQIAAGRCVLIYKGWPARCVYQVREADRLALRDGVLYVDSNKCDKWTVAVKG